MMTKKELKPMAYKYLKTFRVFDEIIGKLDNA